MGVPRKSSIRKIAKSKVPTNKKGDAETVTDTTIAGAGIGTAVGAATGHLGAGAGIGAGVGEAAGLMGVLLSRGPDAMLTKGTTIEMVLDRPLTYDVSELDFSKAPTPVCSAKAPAPRQHPPVVWAAGVRSKRLCLSQRKTR